MRGARRAGLTSLAVVLALGGMPVVTQAAVVTYPVVGGTDDAIETTTPTVTTNGDPLVVRSNAIAANIRHTGLRFPSITVARGSVINRATLEIYCPDASGSFDDFSAAVYGHASDNSPVFGAGVNGINVRTKTTAFQTIYRPNWGGPGWRYIDVTAMVQEIVDRAGWVSGNALSILLIGGGAFPAGEFRIEALENVGTNHARITIDSGATGNLYLREHPSGQPPDQFGTFPVYTGVPLYRFRLQNTTAGAVSVTSLRLRAPSVRGIASADITSLRINDGASDVATGGVPTMGRAAGTITFTPGGWTIPASSTVDYTVYADVGALAGYDTLFLSLAAADVSASSTVSGATLTRARHVADTALGPGPKLVYSDKVGALRQPGGHLRQHVLEHLVSRRGGRHRPAVRGLVEAPAGEARLLAPRRGRARLRRRRPAHDPRLVLGRRELGLPGGRPPGLVRRDRSHRRCRRLGQPVLRRRLRVAERATPDRVRVPGGQYDPLLGLGRLLLVPRLRLRGVDGAEHGHIHVGAARAHPRHEQDRLRGNVLDQRGRDGRVERGHEHLDRRREDRDGALGCQQRRAPRSTSRSSAAGRGRERWWGPTP